MLYIEPINEIAWKDIEKFCQQRLAEDSYLDYKQDFPKHLEKTISAMANTLGGIILIGVAEDSENKPKIPISGIPFKRGLSERVMNIILSNISPPVFPEINVCRSSDGKKAVILVRVPQSHLTPHAITGNTEVYLRTGNRNKAEVLAKIDQIEWLKDRRQKSEQLRENLYDMANERFLTLYEYKFEYSGMTPQKSVTIEKGWMILSLCPVYPKEMFIEPPELSRLYNDISSDDYCSKGKFPHVKNIYGKIVQDGAVYKAYDYPYVFHTQLNAYGLYYYRQSLLRDYGNNAGTSMNTIYSREILCRLEQFLSSGIKYYSVLGFMGPLQFQLILEGIQGCVLKHLSNDEPFENLYTSPDMSIHFSEIILAGSIQTNKLNLIANATQRIFWTFGLEVPKIYDFLKQFYVQYRIQIGEISS